MSSPAGKGADMYKELVNATDYANLYGLYDASGAPVGMMEKRLGGCDMGTYYYSLTAKYSRSDIRRLFREAIER